MEWANYSPAILIFEGLFQLHMKHPTPNEGPPSDAGRKDFPRSMDAFETLEKAIRRTDAEQVARMIGEHPESVRRWRREPETGEGTGTGRRSPLDRLCDLITAVFVVNPSGADLIVEHIRAHLESLKIAQGRKLSEPGELEEKLRYAQMLMTEVSDELRANRSEKLKAVK